MSPQQPQIKKPKVNKDKLAAQLIELTDFEVEQVLRIVQEENDRRNLEWMKAQPGYVKPHALRKSIKEVNTIEEFDEIVKHTPAKQEIEELD